MATIRERNGTYQITVYSGFDLNGRRKRETTTFTPPKELSPKKKEKVVQAFAIDFENRVKNGLVLAGEKTTLREFVDRWREEYASQNLEPGTLEKYNAEIDDKILPMLGHMILTEIKPHNVNAFYVSMTKNGVRRDGKPGGYSKGTITKTANVLSSILKTAVDWEVINRNPCRTMCGFPRRCPPHPWRRCGSWRWPMPFSGPRRRKQRPSGRSPMRLS